MVNHYNHSLAYELSCLINPNQDYIKLLAYVMLINVAGEKFTTIVLILNQNPKLQLILNTGQ